MPTKRNWAGEQQEYEPAGSSKGGEYSNGSGLGGSKFDGKPNTTNEQKSFKSFGSKKFSKPMRKQFAVNELGEKYSKTKYIPDEDSFSKIKDGVKVIADDKKEYSYSEGFVNEWVKGVKEKSKHATFIKDHEDGKGGMSPQRVNYDEGEIDKEIYWQQDTKNNKHAVEPKYEKKATFVFGLPAAGKSSLSDPLKKENGAFEIDADLMKARIPEFQNDPQMVSAVHEESSWMSKKMFDKIREKGGNMVIGKVGGKGNYDSVKGMIDKLKASGYDIDIVVADVSVEQGLQANLGRFVNRYIKYQKGEETKPPRIVDTSEHWKTQRTYFDTTAKFYNDGDISRFKIVDMSDRDNPKVIREEGYNK